MIGDFDSHHEIKRKAGLCTAPGCLIRAIRGRTYCSLHAKLAKPRITRAEAMRRQQQLIAISRTASMRRSVDPPTFVYAIGADGHAVKFGRTTDVSTRLGELQIGSPVRLVIFGAIAVEPAAERAIHEWLARDRMHGEWFAATDRTRAVIDLIIAGDAFALLNHVDPCGEYRKRRP